MDRGPNHPTLRSMLEAALGQPVHSLSPVRGGDIAQAYRAETSSGTRFIKYLEKPVGADLLRAEAGGLEAIARTRTLRTPAVEGLFEMETGSCLVLEYIEARAGTPAEYRRFGEALARMHECDPHTVLPQNQAGPLEAGHPGHCFGWPTDNFIGRLDQENAPSADWAEFYARKRLGVQYRLAREKGLLSPGDIPSMNTLAQWVRDHAGTPSPALVHGDLWAGNHLIDSGGRGVLIDPAVYIGHAEVDLAMTRLFGGYPADFYAGYHRVRPQQPGEEVRCKAYQLYYLLVHLNLFGASYRPGVRRIGQEIFG